jgi:hypothetical protein
MSNLDILDKPEAQATRNHYVNILASTVQTVASLHELAFKTRLPFRSKTTWGVFLLFCSWLIVIVLKDSV